MSVNYDIITVFWKIGQLQLQSLKRRARPHALRVLRYAGKTGQAVPEMPAGPPASRTCGKVKKTASLQYLQASSMNLRWIVVGAGIITVISLGLAAVLQNETAESGQSTDGFEPGQAKEARPPNSFGPYLVDILGGSGGKKCEKANDCYYPQSVTVSVGSTVFWSNIDDAAHTVTSGSSTGGHDGVFDSDLLFSGSTFGYVFDKAGTFDYYCILHPGMAGMVTVVGSSATPPADGPGEPVQEFDPAYPLPANATVLLPSGTSVPGCEKTGRCFVPSEVNVARGATVHWVNDDVGTHTVTGGTVESGPTGMFDTGLFMPGETFDYTFESAGTFDYYCKVHPWMAGTISVR